ncbi:nucleotide exchange factor GrpE [Corynebacterium kalidii]|uniref:Protein GrpE n=1 Tax=Corynebacterium kalidii TaxID=2931982 RepID=A0A9X1WJ22_9CORY|nr:nucleotide exchange factor GrpE [Corynebacterium kalidii]MCJ7857222.1 nucleotide exchange factor GrpE [Corynebacterium kalidii]
MPDNPGDPAVTDEEYTSPDLAETTPEEDAVVAEGADAQVAEALAGDSEDGVAETAEADIDDSGELSDAEIQLAERTADLQRVTAEYANYRRRTERDRVGIGEAAKADVAASLLPIRDDLDLAEQHGDLNGPLKAVADKLDSVLAGLKVETFGAEGDEFDPSKHEAVQDASSGDDKAVGTVLRKGYRMGDRVLRTAMVVIADR